MRSLFSVYSTFFTSNNNLNLKLLIENRTILKTLMVTIILALKRIKLIRITTYKVLGFHQVGLVPLWLALNYNNGRRQRTTSQGPPGIWIEES
jgi:hypothetical protein